MFGARLYIQISDKRLKLSSPQINRSYESTLSVTIEDGTVRIQLRLLATMEGYFVKVAKIAKSACASGEELAKTEPCQRLNQRLLPNT